MSHNNTRRWHNSPDQGDCHLFRGMSLHEKKVVFYIPLDRADRVKDARPPRHRARASLKWCERTPPTSTVTQHTTYSSIDACPTMLSRASLGRHAQRALRAQCCAQPSNRRGLASPASGSFAYETGDAAGTKFASRDIPGPTTTLALVSKAGTRFEILPGLTEALDKSAFGVRSFRP